MVASRPLVNLNSHVCHASPYQCCLSIKLPGQGWIASIGDFHCWKRANMVPLTARSVWSVTSMQCICPLMLQVLNVLVNCFVCVLVHREKACYQKHLQTRWVSIKYYKVPTSNVPPLPPTPISRQGEPTSLLSTNFLCHLPLPAPPSPDKVSLLHY